jgi:hypothetical protein
VSRIGEVGADHKPKPIRLFLLRILNAARRVSRTLFCHLVDVEGRFTMDPEFG